MLRIKETVWSKQESLLVLLRKALSERPHWQKNGSDNAEQYLNFEILIQLDKNY